MVRAACYLVILVNVVQTVLDVVQLDVVNPNTIVNAFLAYRWLSLSAAVLIPLNFYLKSFIRCKLEYSLKKYLKSLNQLAFMKDRYLFLKFSDYDCVVCWCWKCCSCFRLFFYDPTDYETIEIWSYRGVMGTPEHCPVVSESSLMTI